MYIVPLPGDTFVIVTIHKTKRTQVIFILHSSYRLHMRYLNNSRSNLSYEISNEWKARRSIGGAEISRIGRSTKFGYNIYLRWHLESAKLLVSVA